eukprot:Sro29_g018980.2  (238) ;mRNA; r:24036-24749
MDDSSRFFVDTMSETRMCSMDIEAGDERGGLLNGVGKAVSNITHLIMQKRASMADPGDERRKMINYIAELERKLEQKEFELQKYKGRCEQLQLEVNFLKENEAQDEEEETDEDDDEEEEDDEAENEEAQETALIAFEGSSTVDDGGGGVPEGTLIDVTTKAPVFDPLLESTRDSATDKKPIDDNLLATNVEQEVPKKSEAEQDLFAVFEDKKSSENDPASKRLEAAGTGTDDALSEG